MSVQWVNYDLNKTGQNYEDLIDYLKSHSGWAKPLKSSFFVRTSLNAAELRTEIKKYIDTNDDVVVITVDGQSWATYGLPEKVNTWLKNNM